MFIRYTLMSAKHAVTFASLETKRDDHVKFYELKTSMEKKKLEKTIGKTHHKINALIQQNKNSKDLLSVLDENLTKQVKATEEAFGGMIQTRDAKKISVATTKSWRSRFSMFNKDKEIKQLVPAGATA